MRLFRLFQLLDELRLRRTPVTARELAREMGMSLRTLYRDIADLQAMGAPIRGEGGVGQAALDAGLLGGIKQLTDTAQRMNWSATDNGLTVEENKKLASTHRPSEIAALVSLGLGRRFHAATTP